MTSSEHLWGGKGTVRVNHAFRSNETRPSFWTFGVALQHPNDPVLSSAIPRLTNADYAVTDLTPFDTADKPPLLSVGQDLGLLRPGHSYSPILPYYTAS